MSIDILKQRINNVIDDWADEQENTQPDEDVQEVPGDTAPSDQRVVRTKSSGDRVHLLDESEGTRHWVTSAEILEASGFSLTDVQEVEDSELLKYKMGKPIYKVDE